RTEFWFALILLSLSLVVVRLYLSNRAQINAQHGQLAYLCNAVSVQRLVLEQWRDADASLLSDPVLARSIKDKIRLRLGAERVAVSELSSTRQCAQIE